jgi:hypothetical protein
MIPTSSVTQQMQKNTKEKKSMKLSEFIDSLREAFHQELSAKTGWSRQELKLAFERAIPNTLV